MKTIHYYRQQGFSLLDTILALAIGLGVMAAVFITYVATRPSAEANDEANQAATIAQGLRDSFGITQSYSGLTNSTAVASHVVPGAMVSGTSAINSAWGPVTISAAAVDGAAPGSTNGFSLAYASVPQEACAKFIQIVSGSFPSGITVNGDSVMQSGSSVDTTQVSTSVATTKCATSSSSLVTLLGR